MPRFTNLHVISGKDDFKRQETIRGLLDRLAPAKSRMMNVERVSGRELDSRRISDALQAFSLFSFGDADQSRKILFVDDAEQVNADVQKHLLTAIDEAAIRDASDVAVLLVYGPEKDPPKAVVERAGKSHTCASLSWKDARPFIQRYARDTHGVTISTDTADALIAHVGGTDAGPLAREIDKLVLLAEGHPIVPKTVIEATGIRVGCTIFDFTAAFGGRNATKAVSILQDLLQGGENEPAAIAIMLGRHASALLRIRARLEQGMSPNQAASFYYPAFKQGEVTAQARRWTLQEIESATVRILELDLAFKSGAKPNALHLLSTFLHEIAA